MLPAYYINLDSRPNRRDKMEAQFQSLGIPATRVSAAPPDPADKRREVAHISLAGRDLLRPVELANLRSHADIWQRILASGAPAGLVFEDDAILTPSLAAFAQAAPSGFDLIHLETRLYPLRLGRPQEVNGQQVRRLMDTTEGAAAYVITPRAIRYFLASPFLAGLPIDHLLFHAPALYDLRVGQVVPAPAAQADVLGMTDEIAKGTISRKSVGEIQTYPRWLHRVSRTLSLVRFGADLAWAFPRTPVPFSGVR